MSGDLADEELDRLEHDLAAHPHEEDNALVLRLIAEVRRRREAMALLLPWVDHEESGLSTDCTERCPACLLERGGQPSACSNCGRQHYGACLNGER